MEEIYNAPLIAAAVSWLAAQLVKNIMFLCRHKRMSLERLLGAGGMPSSHAAAVCALATAVAITDGVTTAAFAVAVTLALVVMYDASGVRRAAGMHAREINKIKDIIDEFDTEMHAKEAEKEHLEEKKAHLKEFLGHSPHEVVFGALLGIAMGIIIALI
jgi:hypothetical protein